ncbi:BglG family transcription antiterminator [Halobacillus seohaensis]|uniref:BglG family transcription antiterminator n=1 Tax=Halobacillus seohaensis TaxID=447421 RepID=A0ABW2EMN0_9BACI
MNERQTELLQKLLVHKNGVFRVQTLADDLNCSEKTLRNDLEIIEQFLQKESTAQLVRKPGKGIFLSAEGEEKSRLFHLLYQPEMKSDQDRILELTYRMLVEEKALTMNELAKGYFTTKPTIRNDLDVISRWLESYGLQLISKQRLGSKVIGNELDKRNALAHLSEIVPSTVNSKDYVLQLFPSYEVNIVNQTLTQLQQHFSFTFADGELESLLIHALVMIKRTRQKFSITMKDTEQTLVLQSEEYEIADWFFQQLGEAFRLKLPKEEQVYFTWHLISCKRQERTSSSVSNLLLNDVIDQLTFQMQIMTMMDFRNDRLLMDGLHIHLESTIHRVRYGLTIHNPMLDQIKKMYPYMFSMVVLALEEVNHKYELNIPEDEAAYLVLHFQAAVERLEKRRDTAKRVLIVCELGVGMSHLLQAKLEQAYKGMNIICCVGEREVRHKVHIESVDFIISTKSLEITDIPYIVISPLLESKDKKQLDQFLQSMERTDNESMDTSSLNDYLNEQFTFTSVQLDHRYKLIERLANELTEKGKVKPTFGHRVLLRERSSATVIGGGIAIPHARPEEVKQTTIAFAILDKPLKWGQEEVSVVFLLAIAAEDQKLTRPLMKAISRVSEQPHLVRQLIQSKNFSEIKQAISQ